MRRARPALGFGPMSSHMLFRSPDGEVVKVKVGFSWQAFFVGSFKAILRRTWLLAALLLLGYLFYAYMGASFAESSRTIALLFALLALYFLYMLFCGVYGNRWLVTSLLRRGFRQVGDESRDARHSRRQSL
jgi:hypothetical protein